MLNGKIEMNVNEIRGGIIEFIKKVILGILINNKVYYFCIFDVFEKLYIVLIVI